MAQSKNTKGSGTKTNSKSSGRSKTSAANSKIKGSKPAAAAESKKSTAVDMKSTPQNQREDSVARQLAPYGTALAALLLAVCIISGEGKVGGGIRDVFAGLFAGAAYALPIFLLIRTLTWRRDTEDGVFAARSICLGVAYVMLAMLLHVLGGGESVLDVRTHFTDGKSFVGGGVIGGVLGELLMRGFGKVCTLIIIFASLVLLLLYVAGYTPRGAAIYIAYKIKVANDKRRERAEQNKNPARRERMKVQEAEYLEYLRNRKKMQAEMERQNQQQNGNATNNPNGALPVVDMAGYDERSNTPPRNKKPVIEQTPTVYHVKRRRMADIIPDGDSAKNNDADSSDNAVFEETVIENGRMGVPSASAETAAHDDESDGVIDDRIFNEVMRRTRERIEKNRRTENIQDDLDEHDNSTSTAKKPGNAAAPMTEDGRRLERAGAVYVDPETGEVFERDVYDDLSESNESETPLYDDGRHEESPEPYSVNQDDPDDVPFDLDDNDEAGADTTDSVKLAASVAGVSDSGEYDVSDIFVHPEDAELLDKLSEAYKQKTSTQLDVKRGSIMSIEKHEDVKVKAAVPDYKYPPLELLTAESEVMDDDIKEELQANAVKLVETLNSFNVRTKIEDVSRGPTITRYEVCPEKGTKVRAITNLVDDIALNLATRGVRISPIPNKAAIGIEVPNKNRTTVHLSTLIRDERFAKAKSKLTVCLGEDVAGEAVFFDIAKMPHLLIAGTTGSGKSVCINSIITSLLYKASPEDVKMILIDPKKVELNIYNGIPHLLSPVISDPKKAAGALSWAVGEMERRFGLIEAVGVRDITAYNNNTKNDPDYEFMNRIVIIIDELADFMMTAPDEVEDSICRIAQKARAAGMHLIIGTQRPSVNVITGLIKANIPSRIAFAVSSQTDSRVILDRGGAETLIGKGDMLFAPLGESMTRVQGAFVSEDDVEKIVSYIKNMNPNADVSYSDEVQRQIDEEAAKSGAGKKGSSGAVSEADEEDETDPMLKPAIELAVESGKISTSLIQRRLSLGYGRAAKLIDIMENLGYVSAPEGRNPRKVLITRQQYMEMVLKDDVPFDN